MHVYLFYSHFEDLNQESSQEATYLVFGSCLRSLFTTCKNCKGNTEVVFSTTGTMLQVKVYCAFCESEYTWNSQPFINGIPKGNVLMSASILFSGSLLSKVLRLFQIMKCASISKRTFYYHQSKYLYPAICTIWKECQESMFTVLEVEKKKLVLGGDGRCDSPGFSAKYGSYTFMELEYNVVLHVELVQVCVC